MKKAGKVKKSKKREVIASDIETTETKVEKPEKKHKSKKAKAKIDKPKKESAKNAYGHRIGTTAADIDEALEKGGTLEDIAKKAGCKIGRVKGHIRGLEMKHETKCVEKDGKYSIKK